MTTVVAVTRTKNELDIIESSITRMCAQVDHVIVGDGSTDGTRIVLEGLAHRLPVTVLTDNEPTYTQAEQMTALAHLARTEFGADWVVPFDADEVWLARDHIIKVELGGVPEHIVAASAMLYDHIVTPEDPYGRSPLEWMVWRRTEPLPLRKVAVRPTPDMHLWMGSHGATFNGNAYPATITDLLAVHHFPYRTVEQFTQKILVGGPPLIASGMPESVGAHWRGYYEMWERGGDEAMAEWFNTWVVEPNPAAHPHLVRDPLPPVPVAVP